MKIWFDPVQPDPKPVLGINRLGNAGEDFVDTFPSALVHGKDNEFYEVSGGALVAKDQAVVDAIKSQREADAIQAALDKQARIDSIRDKLTGATPAQVNQYIDANVTNLAGAVTYLKRLTMIVRDLAIESNK